MCAGVHQPVIESTPASRAALVGPSARTVHWHPKQVGRQLLQERAPDRLRRLVGTVRSKRALKAIEWPETSSA